MKFTLDELTDTLQYLKDLDVDNVEDRTVGMFVDNKLKALIEIYKYELEQYHEVCQPDELKSWFPAECDHCGYIASSSQWEGGHAIADTGDYSDPICPMCGGIGCEETDNMQSPQDQRPYEVIKKFKDTIATLDDKLLDIHIATLEKGHPTDDELNKFASAVSLSSLPRDYTETEDLRPKDEISKDINS